MKNVLIFALMLAAAQAQAQAQASKPSSSPVADATRSWLEQEGKNLTAAAEEMPADKYDFHPTPEQMTFAHLMAHIAGSNRFLCSGIAGVTAPKEPAVTEKDGKDKLVSSVKASFDYCKSVLAGVDDSRLAEPVTSFHDRSRANVMMTLAADLADHYGMAAMYLRLNGLLPPTAKPKK